MGNINVKSKNNKSIITQMQLELGGHITEHLKEFKLTVDNENASGSIRTVSFDRGITLLEYDIIFHDDIRIDIKNDGFNPVEFIYVMKGELKCGSTNKKSFEQVEQYQSIILSNKKNDTHSMLFKANKKINLNNVQICRDTFNSFFLEDFKNLNGELFDVLNDKNQELEYKFVGAHNLEQVTNVTNFRKIDSKGIIGHLAMEGRVFRILSLHMLQHNNEVKGELIDTSLSTKELNIIMKLANKINNDPAQFYSLEELEKETGLQQAKLQEGFKMAYNRTVTDYIRNARLIKARDLMNTTDLNVSQIVYTIGFSSRSYFSKIFRNKFNTTPSEYLRKKSKKVISSQSIAA